MTGITMTHDAAPAQALDMDTAWMVVACHSTHQHRPAQHPDVTHPQSSAEGSNA